jgi:hypothetical protein
MSPAQRAERTFVAPSAVALNLDWGCCTQPLKFAWSLGANSVQLLTPAHSLARNLPQRRCLKNKELRRGCWSRLELKSAPVTTFNPLVDGSIPSRPIY